MQLAEKAVIATAMAEGHPQVWALEVIKTVKVETVETPITLTEKEKPESATVELEDMALLEVEPLSMEETDLLEPTTSKAIKLQAVSVELVRENLELVELTVVSSLLGLNNS